MSFLIVLIITMILNIIDTTLRLLFSFKIPPTSPINPLEIPYYYLLVATVSIQLTISLFWLSYAELSMFKRIKKYDLEPWVKKRYLILGSSSAFFLLNGFILVALLVWMMAMKEFLVSKEKNWANTLKNIFVLNKHGVCLYHHSFEHKDLFKQEDQTELDEDLISGVLSGVISIISEITRSKKQLRQIQKEEATLLFSHGKYHIIALITSMDLPVLFKKLDEFSREFEHKFSKDLKNFKGNVQRFDPTKFLVVKYFSQKYGEVAE